MASYEYFILVVALASFSAGFPLWGGVPFTTPPHDVVDLLHCFILLRVLSSWLGVYGAHVGALYTPVPTLVR